MNEVIKIANGITRHPLWRMAEPVNLEIVRGEQIAIVGDNAAGKSRLVEILTGHYPLLLNEVHYDFSPSKLRLTSENLKYISFRDSYGEQDGTYYYQQRWNQHDIADDMPTAGKLLQDFYESADRLTGSDLPPAEREQEQQNRSRLRRMLADMFRLDELAPKYIISLSSGELRKFQLAKALGTNPRVLILDNPFIGLDAPTRRDFRQLLEALTREAGLLIILVLSKRDDIPDFITHVLPVEGLRLLPKMERAEYQRRYSAASAPVLADEVKRWIAGLPSLPGDMSSAPCSSEGIEARAVLRFRDVSIRYGSHTILRSLSWTVHEGERWALSGRNGSGKSTLLSLVCADNPQAYACNIELFGRRRGTGESIWEIKRHIGYVCPEMHRAYLKDIPAIDVVASGLSDSVGLYVRPRPEGRQACLGWMHVFGIEHVADTSFLRLSSGEQRLCLLARAFVKDPELLILDEPLHGLDDRNRSLVRQIISQFCQRPRKTLIMVTHYEEELPDCITHRLTLTKPEA
ncbi:MAG: ATP-binding cassette domain-containing protein [Bacteroidaceae bacterium]|nr:ATP-binding cassette domain-containing protein [Bacteroidaceae bacterium]